MAGHVSGSSHGLDKYQNPAGKNTESMLQALPKASSDVDRLTTPEKIKTGSKPGICMRSCSFIP
jgi:hypothetical protein